MTEKEKEERLREFDLVLGEDIPSKLKEAILCYEAESGEKIPTSALIAVTELAQYRPFLFYEDLKSESREERFAALTKILGVELVTKIAKTESLEILTETWVHKLQERKFGSK